MLRVNVFQGNNDGSNVLCAHWLCFRRLIRALRARHPFRATVGIWSPRLSKE